MTETEPPSGFTPAPDLFTKTTPLEKLAMSALFAPDGRQSPDSGYYRMTAFGLNLTPNSQLCPENNCQFGLEDGQLYPNTITGGHVLTGRLKVAMQQATGMSSQIYQVRGELNTFQTFEEPGKITYFLTDGELKIGRGIVISSGEFDYRITNGSLVYTPGQASLVLMGERYSTLDEQSQSSNLTALAQPVNTTTLQQQQQQQPSSPPSNISQQLQQQQQLLPPPSNISQQLQQQQPSSPPSNISQQLQQQQQLSLQHPLSSLQTPLVSLVPNEQTLQVPGALQQSSENMSSSLSSTSLPPFSEYNNSKYGFKIQYPSDWKANSTANDSLSSPAITGASTDVVASITSPSDLQRGRQGLVTISVENLSKAASQQANGNLTAYDYAAPIIKQHSLTLGSATERGQTNLVRNESLNIGSETSGKNSKNLSAWRIDNIASDYKSDVFVINGTRVFDIGFSVPKESATQSLPIFDKMLNSFQFTVTTPNVTANEDTLSTTDMTNASVTNNQSTIPLNEIVQQKPLSQLSSSLIPLPSQQQQPSTLQTEQQQPSTFQTEQQQPSSPPSNISQQLQQQQQLLPPPSNISQQLQQQQQPLLGQVMQQQLPDYHSHH